MEKKDLGLGIGATLLGIAHNDLFFQYSPKIGVFPENDQRRDYYSGNRYHIQCCQGDEGCSGKTGAAVPKRRSPMTESV